jgi:hypothetical protein
MQFKHPEILWFLFLLIIPLIVHLFQLRRFKKEYFTNVQFLKALSVQTRKSSVLKKYLLLATRMLLLAAAIIAFAQPFFEALKKSSSSNELYIILDNSFSMQAHGKQGELLRREVENLLSAVPEENTFSLLTNDEVFWDTDIKSVQRDLQQLSYSATPFNLEAQFAKIRNRNPALTKDVVIITDATGKEQNVQNIDNINAFVRIPEIEAKQNTAIDSVFLEQTLDNFYEIGLYLSANNEVNNLPVALYNKGKLIAKTQTSFKDKTKLQFSIPKEDFHGYAAISDEGLHYDNRLFFSIAQPKKVKVLAIGEGTKNNFLAKIYQDNEFEFVQSTPQNIDYSILEKQEVIIVNELTDLSSNLQTALKSFAQQGGNLIIIPAELGVDKLNNLLSAFGNIKFGAIENKTKQLTRISFQHPLYKTVFEKQVENFQYPEFKSSFKLTGSLPAALTFEDGSALLATANLSASTLFLFTSPLNTENGNFQNAPLIVPTFYNMAQQVSKSGVTALYIGDEKPFFTDAALSKDAVLTIGNTEEQFIPAQQSSSNKVKFTFDALPRKAGNYNIFNAGSNVGNISFNYQRTEGNLIANANLYASYSSVDSLVSFFDKLKSERKGTPLWKWFVVLALVFLLMEVLIQKFVK